MKRTPNLPPGVYGDGNGLVDPERLAPDDRHVASPARLAFERTRRSNSLSPLLRRLQQATDSALRKGSKP